MQSLAFLRQSYFSRDAGSYVPVNGPLVSFGQTDDLFYSHAEPKGADTVLGVAAELSDGAGIVKFEGCRSVEDESPDSRQTVAVRRFEGARSGEALFSSDFAYLCADRKGIVPEGGIKLNFVAKGSGESEVKLATPHILPSGAVDIWPEGFFDEYENVVADLI